MQRIITHVSIDIAKTSLGLEVQRTLIYVESTVASGRTCRMVDRFERLTQDECDDLLDHLVSGVMPGSDLVEARPNSANQMSIF
uniref:Uncharacterized protein n=1 Tax=uncultured prokaryote TaxID=198431 RepID=A0A0H5Q6X4_9ZZZZ|nr:hypothetical protein [uncultured prokaryote]